MKKITAAITSISFYAVSIGKVFAADPIDVNIPTPSNLKVNNLGRLLSGAIGAVLVLASLATFLYLILGGFQWITSGGDKAAVESAQKRIQAAILGLFIVFAAWAIMLIVEQFFGISILRGIKIPTGFD